MSDFDRLTDEEVVDRVQAAVRLAIAKQEAMGIDVIQYDPENGCFYVEEADGTHRIVKDGVKRVKYSDRAKGKA